MPGRSRDIARPESMSSSRRRPVRGSRSTRRIASTARPATSRTRPSTSTGSSPKAEEGQIIPICKLAGPVLIAGTLLLAGAAAQARVERSPLIAYVQARAAASAGALDRASAGFVAALSAAPDNELIASQALGHAVTAGNWRLALEAAHVLERRNAILPDARLLLVAEAFRAHDWRTAATRIDAVEHDQLFAFAAPVLRAWLAIGSGRGDALAALPAEGGQGVGAAYADEHRPLVMLALGRPGGGASLVRAANSAGPRGARLRIAGAALLARRGDRDGALALLELDRVLDHHRARAGGDRGGAERVAIVGL